MCTRASEIVENLHRRKNFLLPVRVVEKPRHVVERFVPAE
jgi:hypothetical protein